MVERQASKLLSLVETVRNGKPTFRLIHPDASMCDFFDGWAYQLACQTKYRTVRTYCYAVKDFLEFIEVVSIQGGGLTSVSLKDALDCYEGFLVFGVESDSIIAKSAAKVLGTKSLSGNSVVTHFAAVNRFLEASEIVRIAILELERSGYVSGNLVSLLPGITSAYADVPKQVAVAIRRNSWFAGCLYGGVRRIKRAGLSPRSAKRILAFSDDYGGDDKVFPIDKCSELIRGASCLRDKLLWSFLAASGCRISEALALLLDDVDAEKRKVVIVDPDTRRDVLIKYMSESEIDKLGHKGRCAVETYLIEPFASMFWGYLDEYIEDEREKTRYRHRPVSHRFLFRNLVTGEHMATSYQTVWERFHSDAEEVAGTSYGFHALRHMYAYYLVNYCPTSNGYGLDLKTVQILLGHSSVKYTEVYARKDARLLQVTLDALNMFRMADCGFSVAGARIKYMEAELAQLKFALEREGACA